MIINVFSYQVRNGKRYDLVEINETIEKEQLPELLQKYRKLIGSKQEEINGKIHHDPDVSFCYSNIEDVKKKKKAQQAAIKPPNTEFKPTTKPVKELLRFHSREV